MEQLKKAIQEAISESGIEREIQQENAVFVWNEVVGVVVSKVTDAVSVNKGVLVVKTKSATWRQELYMQKKDIIDKINIKIGSTAIKEIRFI
jgi:predicted nucleic acid-binding Zn ribbon protein